MKVGNGIQMQMLAVCANFILWTRLCLQLLRSLFGTLQLLQLMVSFNRLLLLTLLYNIRINARLLKWKKKLNSKTTHTHIARIHCTASRKCTVQYKVQKLSCRSDRPRSDSSLILSRLHSVLINGLCNHILHICKHNLHTRLSVSITDIDL